MKRIGSLLLGATVLAGSWNIGVERASAASGGTAPNAPQISSAAYLSLGLASDGTVWAWGDSRSGQLGNGQTSNTSRPAQVYGLSGVKAVGNGYYTAYALMGDGTVRAWGVGGSGQIGDGMEEDRSFPTAVSGLRDITAIATGSGFHELAVDKDGRVWGWGNNDSGQLGEDPDVVWQQDLPELVDGISDAKAVATGGSFSLALTNDGEVWAWGWNKQGQLGSGTSDEMRWTPERISGLPPIVAIGAGYNNGVALDADGNVWGWGQNTNGAIGDGTYSERRAPVKISGIDHVASIAAGYYHTLALKTDGTVWSWGLNNYNQLGDGTDVKKNAPVQVPGLPAMAALSAGPFYNHAVDRYGNGWAWGSNSFGSFGDGTTTSRSTPVPTLARFDLSAPETVGGSLTATGTATDGVALSWTKASDNLTPSSEIKYIPYLSRTGNIDTVAHAMANGTPLSSGLTDADSFAATGLLPGTPYYFNVIAVDANGNRTAYAMKASSTSSEATYSLSYDGNGSDGGSAPTDAHAYALGMSANVQGNSGLLYRVGYTFAGWNTQSDGQGDTYLPGTSIAFDAAGNLVLYAKWEPDTTVDTTPPQVVSFVPGNGATGASVNTKLSMTFSEPIAGVAGKTVAIRRAADDSLVEAIDAGAAAGSVRVSGLTATVSLSAPLAYDTAYRVVVEAGAFKDAAGNDYSGSAGAWTFATALEGAPPAGEDASLTGLAISANAIVQPISPAFDRGRTEYGLSIPNGVSALSVTASVYDAGSVMTVSLYNAANQLVSGPFPIPDGRASGALPIPVGGSRIDVTSTALDGTSLTYRVAVTRASGASTPTTEPNDDKDNEDDVPKTLPSPMTVNGRTSDAASARTTNKDGKTAVAVDIDANRLIAKLAEEGSSPRIVIEVGQMADETTVRLTGEALEALRSREATVELRTPDGSYRLPATELGAERLANLFGSNESGQGTSIELTISRPGKSSLALLNKASDASDFLTVAPPLAFEIAATRGDRTVTVDRFDTYVEREIALPDWMNPNRVTTAVALGEDGSVRPVPTRIVERGGRFYAVIASMTNSAYSVVNRQAKFSDLAGHWAEGAIHDMASRMILSGQADGKFLPNAAVTRAEFTAMLARALGLKADGNAAPGFADVKPGDWFASAVNAANQYGLIEGREPLDGATFRPSAAMTREDAAAMLTQAMKLTGLSKTAGTVDANGVLAAFKDEASIGASVRQAVAASVQAGLLAGDGGRFRPASGLTRAEAASVIQRLLKQSGLID